MSYSKFFSLQETEAIKSAVSLAESQTSGEIRVYVESYCKEDVLDRAAWHFMQMGMQATKDRTGVLIYIAVKSRKLAVIGDCGINAVVRPGFWDDAKECMLVQLRQGNLSQAIVDGVAMVGDVLRQYFPIQSNDVNELPDDVLCGD